MPHPPECLAPNPDVSGIGIRISFYVSTILIAAVPRHPPFTRLLEPLETNNGLNGLALLITAVAESASADPIAINPNSNSLSLYHAIIVLHMLTFLGLAASTVGEYRPTSTRVRLIAITSWCAMVAFFYLTLRVWITAPTFGSQPECNDWTVYVLFGVSVRATSNWLRWTIVGLVCLAIIKFMFTTTRTIIAFMRPPGMRIRSRAGTRGRTRTMSRAYTNQNQNQQQQQHDLSSQYPHEDEEAPHIHESPAQSVQSIPSISTTSTAPPNLFTRMLPSSSFTFKRQSQSLLARVFASIYSVIMLELTIRRNPSSDQENVWSFGQVIALLITLMTVNEIVHFVLGEELGLDVGLRVEKLLLKLRARAQTQPRRRTHSQFEHQVVAKDDTAAHIGAEGSLENGNGRPDRLNEPDLELGARKGHNVHNVSTELEQEVENKAD